MNKIRLKLSLTRRNRIIFISIILGCLTFGTIYILLHLEMEIPEWPRARSRSINDYLSTMKDTATLKPIDLHENCEDAGLVWIFVTSATQNFAHRKIIRETWGDTEHFNGAAFELMHQVSKKLSLKNRSEAVKVTFLVGRNLSEEIESQLSNESEMFGDILQEDFIDSYRNLTLKSMFMIKWAAINPCMQQYKFIVKANDNIFLNVPNLIKLLRGKTIPKYEYLGHSKKHSYPLTVEQRNALILGKVSENTKIDRNYASKLYTPRYIYPGKTFPSYLNGESYVLGQNLAEFLLLASFNENIVHFEDVYVTGILAKAIEVEPLDSQYWITYPLTSACGSREVVFEKVADVFNLPKIMRDIFNTSIRCEFHVSH